MNPAQPNPPWYAPWRGAAHDARPAAAPDPADVGTAFGLDLSMDPEVLAASTAEAARPARGSFMQRLARRSRRD
jgi:hypothetical protein